MLFLFYSLSFMCLFYTSLPHIYTGEHTPQSDREQLSLLYISTTRVYLCAASKKSLLDARNTWTRRPRAYDRSTARSNNTHNYNNNRRCKMRQSAAVDCLEFFKTEPSTVHATQYNIITPWNSYQVNGTVISSATMHRNIIITVCARYNAVLPYAIKQLLLATDGTFCCCCCCCCWTLGKTINITRRTRGVAS